MCALCLYPAFKPTEFEVSDAAQEENEWPTGHSVLVRQTHWQAAVTNKYYFCHVFVFPVITKSLHNFYKSQRCLSGLQCIDYPGCLILVLAYQKSRLYLTYTSLLFSNFHLTKESLFFLASYVIPYALRSHNSKLLTKHFPAIGLVGT